MLHKTKEKQTDANGLKYRLLIIEIIVVVIPCFILFYIFYTNNKQLGSIQIAIGALSLVLVLAGLLLLRQIFDRFTTITTLIKKVEMGGGYLENIKQDTTELREITLSFNNLMDRLKETTDELNQRAFELFSIKDLTNVAIRSLDIDDLLNLLLDKAMAVTRAQIGSVFMVETEKEHFRIVATKGLLSGPKINSYININESLAQLVVYDKKPLLVQDIDTDPRIQKANDPQYGSPSFLIMPIFVREKLIAVLNLAHKDTKKVFDTSDEQISSIMISGISFALDNAQLHSEIKKTNKFLKNILDSSFSVAIVSIDLEGNIIFWNTGAEKIFGYKDQEIIGQKKIDILYAKNEKNIVMEEIKSSVLENKKEIIREFRGVTNDGRELWIKANLTPIFDEEDRLNGILCLGEDITRSKNLEETLRQTQKMEAIGTLAGGIAHDFNNLLMGIQGNVSLMLLDIDSDHAHYKILKTIEQIIQSSSDLTKQLLGVARQGKYEVKMIDLNRLAEETSKILGRTKKEIRIHLEYQKEIWPVEADQSQIEQVFLNLFINAGNAMSGGGDLYIHTENVLFSEDDTEFFDGPPGRYVKISVTDTGVGMDDATQKRIFEPFFTTDMVERGKGLGLASVYGIIKNHGGYLAVSSKKGKGTTINVYLPASEKEIVREIEEKYLSEAVLQGVRTVLLVDDEDMVIEVAKLMLEKMGYKVLLAKRGKEAVEVFKQMKDEIDIIILDIIMPGMSGGTVFDLLKEINPSVKILLASGFSNDDQTNALLKRGCDGFIQKPYNIKNLSQKLKEILDKA